MLQTALMDRLENLKAELADGKRALAELDARRGHLRDTLLRIGGAIQVLEETLREQEEPSPPDADRLQVVNAD